MKYSLDGPNNKMEVPEKKSWWPAAVSMQS